jgi:hypothetical protein
MELFTQLVERLRKARLNAIKAGEMRRDDEARRLWFDCYSDLSAETPGLIGGATNRAEAQAMRLSMIYALLDCSEVIRPEHHLAAMALGDYSFASARMLFGDRLSDLRAQKVWEALKARPEGMTRKMIFDEVFQKNIAAEALAYVFEALVKAGVAVCKTEETGGRRAERWFAKK